MRHPSVTKVTNCHQQDGSHTYRDLCPLGRDHIDMGVGWNLYLSNFKMYLFNFKIYFSSFDEKRYTSAIVDPPVPKLYFAQMDALNDCLVIENLANVSG